MTEEAQAPLQAAAPDGRDQEPASKPNYSKRPATVVSRVVLRRWIFAMLVVGLVLGVFAGRLSSLDWLPNQWSGWMGMHQTPSLDPAVQQGGQPSAGQSPSAGDAPSTVAESTPGGAGSVVSPAAEAVTGQAYGSGLPSPALSQARAPLDPEVVKLLVRIEDLAEQIDFLPSLAQTPQLPDASSSASNFWQRLQDKVSGLFRLRQVDAADQALQSLAAYEMARSQIRFRLLAARLSVQVGQAELAGVDLQVAQAMLAREFDVSTESVQKALAELSDIQQRVNSLP